MTDHTGDAAKLLPHKTVPIQVTVDVDEGIAEMVKYLQTVPGVRTHTSCAGSKTYVPYVMAAYTKEAREYLVRGGFTFTSEGDDWGYIHPPSLTKPDGPENTRQQPAPPAGEPLSEVQIKHMADRFLGWRLPENFYPDCGISFKRTFNDHLPTPTKHEPTGTNLFDYGQAEAMVRYMIEGMPDLAARPKVEDAEVADAVAMLRRLGDGIGGETRDLTNPQLSKAADLLEGLAGERDDKERKLSLQIHHHEIEHVQLIETRAKLAEREAELAKADGVIDRHVVGMIRDTCDARAAIQRHAARQQQKASAEPTEREED